MPQMQELQGGTIAGPGTQPHDVAIQLFDPDRYGNVGRGLTLLPRTASATASQVIVVLLPNPLTWPMDRRNGSE